MKMLFAGPSIHGLNLKGTQDFVVLPPAACGDLLKAVWDGATTIGLVDGVFASERSVWHKEILVALSRGVRVLGASSMGALRAAECDVFGMEGIGQIYADYRDGRRTADSDVALLHSPQEMDYRPLTLALVDAEATIADLSACKRITADEAKVLTQAARALHFTERTWRRIADSAGLGAARIVSEAGSCKVEQKKADALALVAAMVGTAPPQPVAAAGWTLSKTHFLAALEDELR